MDTEAFRFRMNKGRHIPGSRFASGERRKNDNVAIPDEGCHAVAARPEPEWQSSCMHGLDQFD